MSDQQRIAEPETVATSTPGPWRLERDWVWGRAGRVDGEFPLASAYGGVRTAGGETLPDARSEAEVLANARLIAAAPDLLRELKRVTDGFERCIVHSGSDPEFAAEAVRTTREVIAKAVQP